MAIHRPCYSTREDLKRALDFGETRRNNDQLDRAIEAAADAVDAKLRRRFYPLDGTKFWDWPNYQYAYPWRIWLDNWELAALPTSIVQGNGTTIPVNQAFFEPNRSGPPYTSIELNRSTAAAFGGGPTPQHNVGITGTFGYWLQTDPAGTLAAAVSTATGTTITVSDGSLVGVGDLLTADSERLLVADRSYVTTSVTLSAGLTTVQKNDNVLTASTASSLNIGEVLRIGQEYLLVTDQLTTTQYLVQRAWDGSVLTTHNVSDAIYAARQLTVVRGATGTTAATHLSAAAIVKNSVPGLVRELAVAEGLNNVLQETAGYSRTVGEGDSLRPISGAGLADIRARAYAQYGRKNRRRTV